MQPSTTVSQVQRIRETVQKLTAGTDASTVTPVYQPDYPQPATTYRTNEVPVVTDTADSSPPAAGNLLSREEMQRLKAQNTRQLLKSNYWYEIANIARWCTTGLIGATMITIFSVAGLGSMAALSTATFSTMVPAIGVALISGPVLALYGALALAALITVKASQHSRKVFVEKTFDVQDTLMQRQAHLVGKSVEQAVDSHDHGTTSRWRDRFASRAAAAHAELAAAQPDESQIAR